MDLTGVASRSTQSMANPELALEHVFMGFI